MIPKPTQKGWSPYTLIMFLLGLLATGFATMYSSMNERVEANTLLTTKHETDIVYIRESLTRIEKNVDILVNQKLARE